MLGDSPSPSKKQFSLQHLGIEQQIIGDPRPYLVERCLSVVLIAFCGARKQTIWNDFDPKLPCNLPRIHWCSLCGNDVDWCRGDCNTIVFIDENLRAGEP